MYNVNVHFSEWSALRYGMNKNAIFSINHRQFRHERNCRKFEITFDTSQMIKCKWLVVKIFKITEEIIRD